MINVLQRLAELDAQNPRVEKPLISETPVLNAEGLKQLNVNMPEPNMKELKQLSGLNESKIQECGMTPMGAPMPSTPASLSMTAASGAEIVTMMRGLADIAAGAPMGTGMPALGAPMPGMPPAHDHGDDSPMSVDSDDFSAKPEMDDDMGGPEKVSGPTFGNDMGADEMPGGDELADMVRKLKTGQPVKISTNMPVKVKTTNDVKDSTDPAMGMDADMEEDARMWDTSPREKTRDYNPNDFANIFNKVKELDATKSPTKADNPLKAESTKVEKTGLEETTEKLMADYRAFVEEGKKCNHTAKGEKCPVHGLKECGSMYEEEERTMSRAAKGVMKYGKEGMKALAKAGKEGKDLDKIRDKYNKYDESSMAEADEKRAPAKKSEREVTLPSGAKVKATKVQGWQSQKADKDSDKEKGLDEAKKGVRAPKHKIHAQGTASKDWDGDGKKESPKDEVWGSRAKAAAKAGKPFGQK